MAPRQNYIHVQASTAAMNKKYWHSKCHYKRNSGSPSAGTNNPPPRGKACGVTKDDERLAAARSNRDDNHPCPRQRSGLGSSFGAGVTTGGLSPAEDEHQPFRQGDGDPGPLAPYLSRHGWRKSPWDSRTPFSPRRGRKKKAADPRGGGPPTRLIFHLGLDDENP